MNSAPSFARTAPGKTEIPGSGFRPMFEHAPFAAARCNPHGVIVEMNNAFRRSLAIEAGVQPCLRVGDLFSPPDRDRAESLVHDLFASRQESVHIETSYADSGQVATHWTVWRLPASDGEIAEALLIAQPIPAHNPGFGGRDSVEGNLIQAQRWEAVGRLAGGVVHGFQ